MLIQEAEWFAARLAELGDEVFPLCNVGSSTLQFRTAEQPWIDGLLFGPPTRRGAVVRHVDMKAAPGVDLVGDLCNA